MTENKAENKVGIKPGKYTSEYQVAKKGKGWAIVGTVIGMVITLGSAVAQALGSDTTAGVIAGAVISVTAIIQRLFTDLGYIGGRSAVKAAASTTELK